MGCPWTPDTSNWLGSLHCKYKRLIRFCHRCWRCARDRVHPVSQHSNELLYQLRNMSDAEREMSAIGLFARACETLNEFARSLPESNLFSSVRAGSDIRYYETGWRLEKRAEAEINKVEELGAVWCLEIVPARQAVGSWNPI